MTEKTLQDVVLRAAALLGWRTYHTFDSRRSAPGFPDLVLVHVRHGVLFRELKTATGRPSAAQREWLVDLTAAGANAGIWRTSDWLDGTIEEELKGCGAACRPE